MIYNEVENLAESGCHFERGCSSSSAPVMCLLLDRCEANTDWDTTTCRDSKGKLCCEIITWSPKRSWWILRLSWGELRIKNLEPSLSTITTHTTMSTSFKGNFRPVQSQKRSQESRASSKGARAQELCGDKVHVLSWAINTGSHAGFLAMTLYVWVEIDHQPFSLWKPCNQYCYQVNAILSNTISKSTSVPLNRPLTMCKANTHVFWAYVMGRITHVDSSLGIPSLPPSNPYSSPSQYTSWRNVQLTSSYGKRE